MKCTVETPNIITVSYVRDVDVAGNKKKPYYSATLTKTQADDIATCLNSNEKALITSNHRSYEIYQIIIDNSGDVVEYGLVINESDGTKPQNGQVQFGCQKPLRGLTMYKIQVRNTADNGSLLRTINVGVKTDDNKFMWTTLEPNQVWTATNEDYYYMNTPKIIIDNGIVLAEIVPKNVAKNQDRSGPGIK